MKNHRMIRKIIKYRIIQSMEILLILEEENISLNKNLTMILNNPANKNF